MIITLTCATDSYIMGWGGIADSKSLISSLAYATAYFYIGTMITIVSSNNYINIDFVLHKKPHPVLK